MTLLRARSLAAAKWLPGQYGAFADVRLRPALDLLSRIPTEVPSETVVDLGCGSGASTWPLLERWPSARVIGVDSSAAMLAEARAASASGVEWVLADASEWQMPCAVDVLFSNALLHWLLNHDDLIPRLFDSVAPGGVFAAQMPRNFAAPSHTIARKVAGPAAHVLPTDPVRSASEYHKLLAPLAIAVDAWETTYVMVLDGEQPVLNFVRGSYLNPLRDALDTDAFADFEARYNAELEVAYPREANGTTLFPFTRVFFVARKRTA